MSLPAISTSICPIADLFWPELLLKASISRISRHRFLFCNLIWIRIRVLIIITCLFEAFFFIYDIVNADFIVIAFQLFYIIMCWIHRNSSIPISEWTFIDTLFLTIYVYYYNNNHFVSNELILLWEIQLWAQLIRSVIFSMHQLSNCERKCSFGWIPISWYFVLKKKFGLSALFLMFSSFNRDSMEKSSSLWR